MTAVLRVKNWKRFQHYHDRKPAWIKLHRELLDDMDYHMLPLASRALAPMLWLLASEYDGGAIPYSGEQDLRRIAFRLRAGVGEVREALSPLIEAGLLVLEGDAQDSGSENQGSSKTNPCPEPGASAALAECEQDACLERERETEEETERETERETPLSASRGEPDRVVSADEPDKPPLRPDKRTAEVLEVFAHYRTHHARAHPKPLSSSKEWRAIKARLAEGYTVDDLKRAIDGMHQSPFHQGENDRGRRYDSLELAMRDGSKVRQFLELAEQHANGPPPVLTERERRTVRAAQSWVERHRAAEGGAP